MFFLPLLGPVLVAERVVAEDEVEPRPELGLLRHDPLEGGAGVTVLAHLDKQNPDIVHNLDPQRFVSVGNLGIFEQKYFITIQSDVFIDSLVPDPAPSDNI